MGLSPRYQRSLIHLAAGKGDPLAAAANAKGANKAANHTDSGQANRARLRHGTDRLDTEVLRTVHAIDAVDHSARGRQTALRCCAKR
jgi:hypothetical protein